MKKFLGIPVALTVSLLGMTVLAAPEVKPDGTIFDAAYYAEQYPDVVAVYGTSPKKLYEHYQTYGRSENRRTYDVDGLLRTAKLLSTASALAAQPAAQTEAAAPAVQTEAAAPAAQTPHYKFTFLTDAPQTESAWLAELIDNARVNNPTDKYIWSYPFVWDQGLADAAQMNAEEHVYHVTKEKEIKEGAWRAAVPEKFRSNLVELFVDGKGNPEEIVGYWTAYQDQRRIVTEDGETVVEPGRYIHPGSDLNKIFSHNSRYIGVGHVHSDKYYNGNYWVVLLSQ